MAINADTLLDRLYLKSQITRWRMAAIGFFVLFLLLIAGQFSAHSPIEKEFIARLTFDGFIGDDREIYDLIDDVSDNPKAKAVIVWLDTPGGSAVGGEEIFLRMRRMAEKKPVVTVMRSVAASAGYMIALGSDYIIAREGTITGSIGVIIETAEITELAQKLGIKPIIIKTSPLKSTLSPFEKSTPESERTIQEVINDFYDRFVTMVSERRNLPKGLVIGLADGRVYSGKGALDKKLIDAIGGEEEALQWLVSQRQVKEGLSIRDISLNEEISLFDELTQSIFGNFLQNRSVGLDGLVAVWHPQLH